MKKIAIYNLEPKYINIALEKIRMYYELKGYDVENYFALNHDNYNKIYCSSIFDFTDKTYVTPDMICGGSGFNLITKLPKKIGRMNPKINIGRTTVGCNRKCKFCIVWKKEPEFKIIGTFYDFWDRISKVIYFIDNNILFNKKHFINECKNLIKEKISVSFNQGLDIRLIDSEICLWLSKIKHHNKIKFAWDNYNQKNMILKKIDFLISFIKPSKIMMYVLCGFNTTFDQDQERVRILKMVGIDPFVMLHHKKSKLLNEFARYNNRFYFRNISFEQYLKSRKRLYLLNKNNA